MSWWDNFAAGFEHFWNQPVPIIGFTVGTVIIGAIVILAKTSIGKKALSEIRAKFNVLVIEIKNALNSFKQFKEEKQKEIDELDGRYRRQTEEITAELRRENARLEEQHKRDRQLLRAVAANINNVKIRKALEEYDRECEQEEQETTNA